jgi:hypothetical protein
MPGNFQILKKSQTVGFSRSLLLFVVQADPFFARPTTLCTRAAAHYADVVEQTSGNCKHRDRASDRSIGGRRTSLGLSPVLTRTYEDSGEQLWHRSTERLMDGPFLKEIDTGRCPQA